MFLLCRFLKINLQASFSGCLAGSLAGSLQAFFKNEPASSLQGFFHKSACKPACRQPPPASTLHAPCTLFLRFLNYFYFLCFMRSVHDRWKNHGHFWEFHQSEKKRKNRMSRSSVFVFWHDLRCLALVFTCKDRGAISFVQDISTRLARDVHGIDLFSFRRKMKFRWTGEFWYD